MKFLESRPGVQAVTGGRRRIGSDFRHQRGSGANEANIWVHYTFSSRAILAFTYRTISPIKEPKLGHPAEFGSGRTVGTSRSPWAYAPRAQGSNKASDGRYGWKRTSGVKWNTRASRMGTYVNACRERKSRTATTSRKAIPQIISKENGSSGNSSQAAGEGEQP